jgi:hypothetical protein
MAQTREIQSDEIGTWMIAPADQGQIVEVAYASTEGGIVRRVIDRSEYPPRPVYEYARWDLVDTHGDETPAANEAPTATSWAACRVVS